MRNPLSAILQCADEISSSLSDFRASEDMIKASDKLSDLLDSGIDAAQTIALCGKSILFHATIGGTSVGLASES